MQSDITWNDLHDDTLVSIEVRWLEGTVKICIDSGVPGYSEVTIEGKGLRLFECPRLEPWGASESINGVKLPTRMPDADWSRLEIEMQSGDVIKVDADSFVLTAVP